MNAVAELKPADLGRDHHEVERIARALELALITYHALPNFPANQDLKAVYWRQYQTLCGDMMEALRA